MWYVGVWAAGILTEIDIPPHRIVQRCIPRLPSLHDVVKIGFWGTLKAA